MKIIIGAGNPGVRWARTVTNIGCIILDNIGLEMASIFPKKMGLTWRDAGKFVFMEICEDPHTIIIKPRTYLAKFGQTVKSILRVYNTNIEDLMIAHYDMELEMGKHKIEKAAYPQPHPFLDEVKKSLIDTGYQRIAIGAGGARFLKESSDEQNNLEIELSNESFSLLKIVSHNVLKELNLDAPSFIG